MGIGFERRKSIPLEIIRKDGSLSNNLEDIMHKWKTYFSDLLNQHDSEATGSQEATQQDSENETGYILNRDITFDEVRQAARKLRKGKCTGYDEIPAEVLCFDSSLSFLHRIFRI